MSLRLCQTALVASLGAHLLLVVFNNLTDYGANFAYVSHVLTMDTTFADQTLRWRALEHPAIHHGFYAIVILWESAAAALCLLGAVRLWRARHAAADTFAGAKRWAITGLTVSLLLWLVAFLTVGGEWFLMWQSRTWNGQVAATRMFMITGVILLILLQRDVTPAPDQPAARR